jgi:hypothetical protein
MKTGEKTMKELIHELKPSESMAISGGDYFDYSWGAMLILAGVGAVSAPLLATAAVIGATLVIYDEL